MDVKEEAFKIKRRVIDLKAQQKVLQGQIDAITFEVSQLKEIKCPACNGVGNIDDKNNPGSRLVCQDCEGTGILIGNMAYSIY